MDDAVWSGSMPDAYDRALGPALFQPHAEHLAAAVAALRPRRALETAAGTGRVTRCLLEALPGLDLLATDLNEAMVAWGREHAPGATWQVAGAHALPLPDDSVDVVVCSFGLMFFPDRVAAHREALRVLAPGGTLLHTVWQEVSACTLPAAVADALDVVFPQDGPDFVRRVPYGLGDPDLHVRELRTAGLREVRVERVDLQGEPARPGDVALGICTGTPLRTQLSARGDVGELARRIRDEVVREHGDEPVRGRLGALLLHAQAP